MQVLRNVVLHRLLIINALQEQNNTTRWLLHLKTSWGCSKSRFKAVCSRNRLHTSRLLHTSSNLLPTKGLLTAAAHLPILSLPTPLRARARWRTPTRSTVQARLRCTLRATRICPQTASRSLAILWRITSNCSLCTMRWLRLKRSFGLSWIRRKRRLNSEKCRNRTTRWRWPTINTRTRWYLRVADMIERRARLRINIWRTIRARGAGYLQGTDDNYSYFFPINI